MTDARVGYYSKSQTGAVVSQPLSMLPAHPPPPPHTHTCKGHGHRTKYDRSPRLCKSCWIYISHIP